MALKEVRNSTGQALCLSNSKSPYISNQTSTNGYKFQGTPKHRQDADELVKSWGNDGAVYQPTPEYQARVRELQNRFTYRLDTNYAKMDRIKHTGLEAFKTAIGLKKVKGMTVNQWTKVLGSENDSSIRLAVETLGIKDSGAEDLVH